MTGTKSVSRILPYIISFVCFALVSAVYFAPQFSGDVIEMHDVTQLEGMRKEILDHEAKYGEDPQWTGSMFGGMPAQLIHMKYDSLLVQKLQGVLDFMGRPASFIFVAMAAFFIMLMLFGVDPWIGMIPSLAYGLSTYFFLIIGAGHITKMMALAYAPLMIGGMGYMYRGNMWLGGALTALFASLELSAGHVQITYYFLFVMLALWINELVKSVKEKTLPRFAKVTGVLVLAGVLAAGSNMATLWYTLQYGKESMRGGSELTVEDADEGKSGLALDYATAWSYGKMESFNMYIPGLMGGSSSTGFAQDGEVAGTLRKYDAANAGQIASYLPAYWGDQPGTGGPTYIGAVIIYLCVLGLFLLRGRCKWWVVAVTAVAIMLAWGKNFMWFTELFYYFVPGYDKFRTVAMILVIAEWSVPFIAAFILHKVWKNQIPKEELVGGIKKALYVTGGASLFFLLLGGVIFDFSAPSDAQMGLPDDVLAAMRGERASMMRWDAFRSLMFVLLTAGTVWLFAAGRIKNRLFIVALAVLVCADLIPVDIDYLPQSRFVGKNTTEIKPTQADLQILTDTTTGFRVLNTVVSPFQDATTSYFHRSAGGYHGAKMQRYQDIIDRYLSQGNTEVINMLDTRYIIQQDRQSGALTAHFNPDANGTAWFVEGVVPVDSPAEEIERLGEVDLKREAVVERRFADMLPAVVPETDSTDRVFMTEYRSNYLKYRYRSANGGLIVFSEIYYDKGWTAWLDGVEVPYFRADYILRGMFVPAGDHVVEFRYRADNYGVISTVTLIFSLLIITGLAAAAVGAVLCNRKKKKENAREQED